MGEKHKARFDALDRCTVCGTHSDDHGDLTEQVNANLREVADNVVSFPLTPGADPIGTFVPNDEPTVDSFSRGHTFVNGVSGDRVVASLYDSIAHQRWLVTLTAEQRGGNRALVWLDRAEARALGNALLNLAAEL